MADGRDVVRRCLDRVDLAYLGNSREREPRIYGCRAEAEKNREVVHLAHLAGLHHDADGRTHPGLGQRFVNRRHGKESGYSQHRGTEVRRFKLLFDRINKIIRICDFRIPIRRH